MSESAAVTVKKRKKRKKWPWVLLIIVLIVAACLLLVNRNYNNSLQSVVDSIQNYTVNKSSITSTVVGTGNLSYDESENYDIPVGIEIDEVIVKAGDLVSQGDVLATLDPLSVENAIDNTKSRVNALASSIYNEDAKGSDTITSSTGGRIKLVYAQVGDSVADVMAEYGALMVLSMDGKLAVDVPAWDGAELGDEVTVSLPSGSNKTGTVSELTADTASITISDNGPLCGDEVEVYLSGDLMGSGALYIHHPVSVVGTDGVIDKISYSENSWVGTGTTLFRLRDLSNSTTYQQLRKDLDDWEAQLVCLMQLSNTYTITAPFDGAMQAVLLADGQTVAGEGLTTTAFTICPTKNMLMTIGIDELDILSVAVGQSVSISIDAITSETFDGVITSVSDSGTVVGGAATYSVEITVPRASDMRSGMTASATIVTGSKDNIVVIPADAIQEQGNDEFVYTAFDEKTGELSGEVVITTGLSDGIFIEVPEGLSEGTVIYYKPAGSVDYLQSMMSFWQN